ncbi:ead/Ea22-like family protein [Salmonella enterica]|nr:ead/Ea22-like family protein [Salmonella enterica]
MSNIDKQALREAAERAMHDDWGYDTDIFHEQVTPSVVLALLDELEHYKSREERVTKLVLDNSTSWDVLYEKLEAAEKRIAEQREYYEGVIADGSKRIAELEHSETQLINERDSAESALNDAYKAVMGQAPEWSNWFSFENAIDEIELVCELWRNQTDDVIQFRQLIAEQSAIVAAAEKLVRCKGRYHSELNYRALAKLFGVVTPDLPPLEHENVHYADAAEVEITALRQRIQELEAKLETADRLQDGAFRDGLKAGFSYGQTDDQSGFAQCMSAYSTRAGIKVKES